MHACSVTRASKDGKAKKAGGGGKWAAWPRVGNNKEAGDGNFYVCGMRMRDGIA